MAFENPEQLPAASLKTLEEFETGTELAKLDTSVAWNLGVFVKQAIEAEFASKSVTIDITTVSNQCLFRAVTRLGSTFDNDEWVRRKRNTVIRFGKSSYYVGSQMRAKGKTLEEARFVSFKDYADHGGSIPLRITSSDVIIATLTISGLAQEQDHFYAVSLLKKFNAL